jgi:hypothetical protein
MHYFNDDTPDDLIHEAQAERRYLKQLSRHPDPRDPDHPELDEGPTMTEHEREGILQIIYEQLNGTIDDIKTGHPEWAISTIEDCIELLAEIGVNQ